jgi:subtilisin family serine protease
MKPDVVAPGERVLSCAYDFGDSKPLYVEMSGTSMATPHISGLLAAFLSRHQEFIGRPDEVKAILLNNCTDLKRDPYMQGGGLPNLVRMLANT